MFIRLRCYPLALILFANGAIVQAGVKEISGTVELRGSSAEAANITDAIVYFVPDIKPQTSGPTAEYQIAMVRKQFVPRTMAVGIGSTVHIPNDDSISHNAFSPSKPSHFDLDLYGKGESKSFTVNGPGVVRIYCNVHYHMVAYVLALDTPYHTQPDADGHFSLKVPEVPGKLVIWHERTNEYSEAITPALVERLDVQLRITKRRLPAHNNKFGHSYRRVRR